MLKQGVRQLCRLTVLGSLWCLLIYSLLFGGFTNSLADYYGGNGNITCQDISCKNQAYCGGPGTPNGCTITCQSGAIVTCPK